MPPLPAWVIPGIGAAANIAGNLINAGSQRRENTRQRQFQMDMYNRQRNDALADWNMQNAYNDPSAMMARLKQAGLNPNLAYGNPTTAGVASVPRSASGSGYNSKAPQIETTGISDAIMMFYDIQKTQAQTDNIKAQAELAKVKEEMTNWQIDNIISDTIGKDKRNRQADLDYFIKDTMEKGGYYNSLTKRSLEQAQQEQSNTRRAKAEAVKSEVEAFIKQQTKYTSIEQAAQNLINSKQMNEESKERIKNMIKDGKLKDFEIKLNQMGFTKGDPYYIRATANLLTDLITL